MRNVAARILSGLLAISFACVSAEENRFKSWIDDNILYRFDNQTAEIHKLVKPAVGEAMWVRCNVVEPKAQSARAPIPAVKPSEVYPPRPNPADSLPPVPPSGRTDPRPPGDVIDSKESPPKNPARRIELFNEYGANITDAIDDSMRDEARATINGYDKLGVSHTLKTNGDRISGIIILDNKGDRKIGLIELTMFVPVHGAQAAKVAQRFVFNAYKTDADRPPAASNGMSGLSVMKKVDVAAPSGVISGMPEVRVTYLRFQE